jgi:pimeloyl-ACP methyl ester carboxylesterase
VLVHGLASNHTRWNEFVSTTRLRDSWDLLRVDLRGFGDSVTRRRTGFAEWARDLAAILDAEHAARAVVVGHCLGANVAAHFAARYPTMTDGLVLIEPMFREALTGMARTFMPARPLVQALATLVRGVNRLGVHRGRLATLDLEQLDREARAVTDAKGMDAFPEERYGSALEDLKYTPTAAYLTGLVALAEPMPDLRRIVAPVLALLSTGGRFGDPAITARRLADLPRGETRTLTARHWIPTECPVEMREAIDGWCSTMRG